MSVDRCSRCGDLVDTDDEPEAYVQVGNMRQEEKYICLCRRHREQYEDEREGPAERKMPADWKPTAEQQAIMDAADSEGGEE